MAEDTNTAPVDGSTPLQAAPESGTPGDGNVPPVEAPKTETPAPSVGMGLGNDGYEAAFAMAGGDVDKMNSIASQMVPPPARETTLPPKAASAAPVVVEEPEVDDKDLTMPQRWALIGGTIVGRDHVGMGGALLGGNNQDAMFALMDSDYFLGVVCDGCSSSANSEVGAKLLARMVAKAVIKHRKEGTLRVILPKVQAEVIAEMKRHAEGLAIEGTAWSVPKVAEQFFLATILGVYVTNDEAVFFGLGDGCYGWDDRVEVKKPWGDNEPAYIGYHLYSEWPKQIGERDLKVYDTIPSYKRPDLIWIGTDGFGDLRTLKGRKFPGTNDEIPSIQRLLEDPKLYDPNDPGALNGKLRALQQESMKVEPVEKRDPLPGGGFRWTIEVGVSRALGTLMDDTTVIALGRKKRAKAAPATTFGSFGRREEVATPSTPDPIPARAPWTPRDFVPAPPSRGTQPLAASAPVDGGGRSQIERSGDAVAEPAVTPQGADLSKVTVASPVQLAEKKGLWSRFIAMLTAPFRAIAKWWEESKRRRAEDARIFRELEEADKKAIQAEKPWLKKKGKGKR